MSSRNLPIRSISKDNFDIFDFELTKEEMEQIREVDKNVRFFMVPLEQQETQFTTWAPEDQRRMRAQGKLGFGFTRLPVIDGVQENIDLEQLNQMADEFLRNGFTYFDTSYSYRNGKSEEALRKSVVERYPRRKFTIAMKFLTFLIQAEDQVEDIFA